MEKVRSKLVEAFREAKRVSKEDPRRIVHSFKVGIALAFVSSFYYYQPLYDNLGVSAMWAVMTVIVVFEFSVGATLGKGINRGVATLLAGGLGIGAHHLANLSGETGEPIILGILVFIQAAIFTFLRFIPKIKARYDYGFMIFILTFSLITVSGFREDEILELAHKRLSTVIVGGLACVIISIFICPVWAGVDLHNLVSNNLEKLGNFLEGFGDEYFEMEDSETENGEKQHSSLEGYKSVLNSKNNEEALANFANWEPRHGRFRYRHPWQQYLVVGALARQCAYRIDALNAYLKADFQAPPEIKKKLEDPLRKMSLECGKALKEMSKSIKKMNKPSSSNSHIRNSQSAAKTLNSLLKSDNWKDIELRQVIPLATVSSLLCEIVNLTEQISESVYKLASSARFKDGIDQKVSPEKSRGKCENLTADSCSHVSVSIDEGKTEQRDDNLSENSVQRNCKNNDFGCPCAVLKVDGSISKNPKVEGTSINNTHDGSNAGRGV